MVPLIVPIGALLIGIVLLLLGVGLLNTILALRSGMEGYSDSLLGIIMSSYFLGFFIGTFVALPLVRRIGHIRAFAACASIISVCVLLHQMLVNPYAWMLIRVVTGVCLVIVYTVIESWLNGQTPQEQRGKVFAIYMTANLGALAFAQQLLLVDPSISFLLFALASILISISLVPVTWTRMQQPRMDDVSSIKLRQLMKAAPVAVYAALLSGLVMGAFWGLSAAYGNKLGLTTAHVATFVTVGILGGAICQFPLGRYSDAHDRRKVLMVICLGAGLVGLAMSVMGSVNVWLLFVLMAAYGGFAFAVYPVAVAHMVDHLDPKDMLSGGSGLLFIHGIGAMLGPVIAGQIMSWTTPSSLPLYWAILQLATAAVSWFYIARTKRDKPENHTADFVPMVRTTSAALEMLPADSQSELFDEQNPVWGNGNEEQVREAENDDDIDADIVNSDSADSNDVDPGDEPLQKHG